MIALIDCNNFYCSCEQVFQPQLRNRAMIVLSNNDGCAISRSEEARALGIKMGTPHFMISKLAATFLTYWWNFGARKYFLHRGMALQASN